MDATTVDPSDDLEALADRIGRSVRAQRLALGW
jgi:hypothetical protein